MSIKKYTLFVLINILISELMFGGFCKDFLCCCCRRNSGDENGSKYQSGEFEDDLRKFARYVDASGNPVGLIVYSGKTPLDKKTCVCNTMYNQQKKFKTIYGQAFCSLDDFINRPDGIIDAKKIYGLSNLGHEYTKSLFLLMPLTVPYDVQLALLELKDGKLCGVYSDQKETPKELGKSVDFIKETVDERDAQSFLNTLDSEIKAKQNISPHNFPIMLKN